MKILKSLHQAQILDSVRGVRGGYRLASDLREVSLYQLIDIVRGIDRNRGNRIPTEPPLLAVHSKLMRFLRDVKLSDLLLPGHRIDVPLELVGFRKVPIEQNEPTAAALAG